MYTTANLKTVITLFYNTHNYVTTIKFTIMFIARFLEKGVKYLDSEGKRDVQPLKGWFIISINDLSPCGSASLTLAAILTLIPRSVWSSHQVEPRPRHPRTNST